tara:strand:- start:291 stop:710 length:420 start_codon:yes stop_codon:yes gene_type:complete
LLLNGNLYSQDKKETAYLLFDTNSKEQHDLEDGAGNTIKVKKYRKSESISSFNNNYCINFNIGNEEFSHNKARRTIDTCSIDKLKQLKLVDIEYMVGKYEKSGEFKHHVFEKIFFIEKISRHKITITEVGWTDEIFVVD